MPHATLTSKGQTTIPVDVRKHLGIKSGDHLDFLIRSDGEVILKPAHTDVRELRGILHRPGKQKPVSVEEMNEIVRKSAVRRFGNMS